MDRRSVHSIQRYRGYRIVICDVGGAWQARVEGIGALSDHCSTPLDAMNKAKRYLDDQAGERLAVYWTEFSKMAFNAVFPLLLHSRLGTYGFRGGGGSGFGCGSTYASTSAPV
jgi:hypothetical protein